MKNENRVIEYEELTPYILCNIAKLSYFDENKFKNSIHEYSRPSEINFYDGAIHEDSDAQMYTLVYPDKIIFSIRGTSYLQDRLIDINIRKTLFQDIQYTLQSKNKKIKVHKGFLSQFNIVKFRIISYIFSAMWGNKCYNPITNKIHVIFTSHSLGSAISTLASTLLKCHFGDKLFVENWTFGCPLVGNSNFMNYYNNNIDVCMRYIYEDDIVTKIPRIGFKNFTNYIKLKNREKPLKPHKITKCCFMTIKSIKNIFGDINDHYIDNYIRALNIDKNISNIKHVNFKDILDNIENNNNNEVNIELNKIDNIPSVVIEKNDNIIENNNETIERKLETENTENNKKTEKTERDYDSECINKECVMRFFSVII
jgi:hypothetical protein